MGRVYKKKCADERTVQMGKEVVGKKSEGRAWFCIPHKIARAEESDLGGKDVIG